LHERCSEGKDGGGWGVKKGKKNKLGKTKRVGVGKKFKLEQLGMGRT